MAGPAPHRALRHEYGTAVIVYVVPSILNWGQLLSMTCPLLASLASPQRVNGPDLSTIVCTAALAEERVNRMARVPEPWVTARMFKGGASKSSCSIVATLTAMPLAVLASNGPVSAAPSRTIPLVMLATTCPVCAYTS
jgi:hypothetical protein